MASNTKYYDNLTVSNSPHLVTSLDTTRTMLYVVAALLPAAAMSILYFGIPAFVMIAGSLSGLMRRSSTSLSLSATEVLWSQV